MYRLIYLVMLVSFSFGFEIDVKSLEKNINKSDVKDRILLSKYYLKHYDINKSKKYAIEALKLDPKNKAAKKFITIIHLDEDFKKYLKDNNSSLAKIDEFYKNLYDEHKYKEIKKNSIYIYFIPNDYPKLVTARVLMWDGMYKKSEYFLKLIKNKNSFDYSEIKAYDCFYLEQYSCAQRTFELLYSASYKLEYAYKLIDIYFFVNNIGKADSFISKLLKVYPHSTKILDYKKRLIKLKKSQLLKLEKIYKNSHKFLDLQKLVFVLLSDNKNKEAYTLLQKYIKKHPKDENAKYWYATYLSWGDKNNEALKILENIKDNKNYKVKLLIAKILAWGGKYQKSINYLNDIIANSSDKKIIIDSKELLGLIYFWQKKYKKAKPILKEVLKRKSSVDAKEALMIINGDIKPLIKKYTLLHNREPYNLDYILKIAQFSEAIKDVDTAIKFYEEYYAKNPKIDVAHSLARLYLIKNNPYKAFGYYEYWAYQVNSEKSLFELAKAYYYAGYSKSALDVISEILRRYPNSKEAVDLKAKILKYNPKFTQNNSKKSIQDILNDKYQKLLTLGNRLYFNGFYKESSDYFKKYLLDNANDYVIRERYAYALEFTGDYKKASGEFFLLSWMKKDCDILYHYGFNLEKSGKNDKAFIAYKNAEKYALKPLNNHRIINFINNWKKAWESMKINKYKQFYSKKYRNNKLWLLRKESIFRNVKFVSIYLAGESLLSKSKENNSSTIYKIKFFQQYTTNKKKDKGYKTLTIKCNKKCVIENEKWKKSKFTPPDYTCYKRVESRKKFISMQRFLKKIKESKDGKTIPNYETEIQLATALKKDLSAKSSEVLATFDVNTTKKTNILKKRKTEITKINNVDKFGVLGQYDKDNTNMEFLQYGIYNKYKNLYVDLQRWKLFRNSKERDGRFLTLKIQKGAMNFGGEIGNYEGFNYFYPALEYKSYFNYKLYQSVTGKDKQSFCAIDKHLNSINLEISKYKGANVLAKKDITDYWYSLGLAKVSDNNLVITPQFQYRFDAESSITQNTNIYYYLSGWYNFNSQENTCYYSPQKYDSTFLEIHPVYRYLELIGKIGYSFLENTSLYSYGFDFQYNDFLKFNCMKNYSYRDGISGYSYVECKLNAGITW